MAAGPKAAGFASFMRIFVLAFLLRPRWPAPAGTHTKVGWVLWLSWPPYDERRQCCGIVQNNVKRMLAYSSIAPCGYALVGFVAAGAASDTEQRSAALPQ